MQTTIEMIGGEQGPEALRPAQPRPLLGELDPRVLVAGVAALPISALSQPSRVSGYDRAIPGASMNQPPTPHEVFLQLVNGVAEGRWSELPELYAEQTDVTHPFHPLRAPALRTRDELRAHFTPPAGGPEFERKPANIRIHDTADPEVIVAEFEYRGTVLATGESFAVPCIFVLRVRDGKIVESRDYIDPLGMPRVLGRLDDIFAAMREQAS
jgi:ketosteroid isomerase-like protein